MSAAQKWKEVDCELCKKSNELQKIDIELQSSIYCGGCKRWMMLTHPAEEKPVEISYRAKQTKT